MAKKKASASGAKRKPRPASTPEAREKQLVSLAYDLAEERLLDGTASSGEVVQLLKLGSTKAEIEKEKIKRENELIEAKTEALESQKRVEELYADALNAMKRYSGANPPDEEE